MRPVSHSVELPVLKPLKNQTFSDNKSHYDDDDGQQGDKADCNPTFDPSCSSSEPHLLTQGDLNNLVCDLEMSQKQAEFLDSRLKNWNFLHQDTEICFFSFVKINSKNFCLKKTI